MSSAGIFDENISAVWAIWREQNNRVFHFCGMSYLARTFTASRSFSVKSAYYLMSSAGKAKSRCPSVCSARVTPSTQIFFVLLLKDKLLTQDVMLRRKFVITMGCVLCGSDIIETALHLFINCPMAAQIWRALSAKVNMPMISLRESVLDTYLASTPRGAGSQVEHWLTYFISTVWAIWRERNNRIFRQQHTLVPLIVENICMEGRLSLKYCS
jgi:zinc-binding in reverse transcriptase